MEPFFYNLVSWSVSGSANHGWSSSVSLALRTNLEEDPLTRVTPEREMEARTVLNMLPKLTPVRLNLGNPAPQNSFPQNLFLFWSSSSLWYTCPRRIKKGESARYEM